MWWTSFEELIAAQLVKKNPLFIEAKFLVPFSQKPIIWIYPDSDKFSTHP
jgi:hypothetical protein